MSTSEPGFDRIRVRRGGRHGGTPRLPVDPQGRRSLYSVTDQPAAPGAVTLACSGCEEESVVTPRQLIGLALPSLHLPLIRRGYPSWMRCPACGRRTWVRLGLSL